MKNCSFEDGHDPIEIGNCPKHWRIQYLDGETPPGFELPALAPEIQVPSKQNIPQNEWSMFFLDGDHCAKIFKGEAPIWFALSQTVTNLSKSAVYRFTAPVHLDVYEWEGRKVYPADGYAAEAHAGLGDTWDTVDWADWQAPAHGTLEFGEYGEVVLEFEARGESETLWVECKAKWADLSNNFFFDAFRLECVEEPPEPPKRQYERTYVLLPQDATVDELLAQVDEHYENKRTIGYSADDAFVNPVEVTDRTVIVPYNRFPGSIVEFAEQYYPGAHIILEGVPIEPPTPPVRLTRGHFGPHIQSFGDAATKAALLDYFKRVNPPVAKVFHPEDAYAIKVVSPHTAVVFRHWMSAGDQAKLRDNPDKRAAAREYIAHFRSAVEYVVGELTRLCPEQDPVLYVESINEEYECNHPKNIDTAAFDAAFIQEVAALGLSVRCSVFTAAQGNPEITSTDLDIVLDLARVAEEYGALMGYHNYWGANIALAPGELLNAGWPWSPGRWQLFDQYCVSKGVHPLWFGGETGPCTSNDGVHLDPGGGWRASGCHAGKVERLVEEIMLYEDRAAEWNAENDDRYLGGVAFTDGAGDWPMFLYGSAWYSIGDAMLARYS